MNDRFGGPIAKFYGLLRKDHVGIEGSTKSISNLPL